MLRRLTGWIRAWRVLPFLLRRSSGGRWLARVGATLHFRFGRLSYAQRERFDAARLGSQSAWALVQCAAIPFLLAVVAVILFGMGPFAYDRLAERFAFPVLVRFPPVDPQSFSGVMGTTAQATAAVLALFFAAISVVASTAYAKMTTEVRALIAQDPLNRRYLRLLAHVTAAALGAAGLQSAGYLPSAALLWYVLSLAGVCMVAFLPLGIRTFALFDPASLAVYPARNFSRALAAVGESGHRWRDPSFQSHANRVASGQLGLLEDLVVFAIADSRPRNDTVVALIRHVVWLGAYYATRKHSVPSDSLWFTRKAEFRRWEAADSAMTDIALQTGVTPLPEHVPDHAFVESRVSAMAVLCVVHLIGRNAHDDLATVLLDMSKAVTSYAKHFDQREAMETIAAVRKPIVERLKATDTAVEPLKHLQIVDLLGYCSIAPILHTPLAITETPVPDAVALSPAILKLQTKALYGNPRPRKVLQDAEDLLRRLEFERAAEGSIRTADWYGRQILALAYAASIREVISNVVLIVEREFVTPPTELASAKRSLWAAIWLQRSIEACHKAADRIHALETRYEELKGYQVAELQWRPSGADSALTKIEEHRAAVVRLLAAIVPDLITTPTDQGLPDVLGPARAWIADELLSMMERKEDKGFPELFNAYFTASLAVQDHFIALMRDSGHENYMYVAMNTMLDVMDVSGFAL